MTENVEEQSTNIRANIGGNTVNDSASVEAMAASNSNDKKKGLLGQAGDTLAKLKFWGGRRHRRTHRRHRRRRKHRRTRKHRHHKGGKGKKGFSHPKRGQKSRTRKGNKDFTTKRGNKVFHRRRHYVRKSRKPYHKRH